MTGAAEKAADEYAKLPDVERSIVASRLIRDTRFAYVYRPDLYEELLASRLALRPEQIPAWVYADAPERCPKEMQRDDLHAVQTQFMCGGRGAGKGHSGASYFAWQLLERPGFRLEILGPSYTISMGVDIKGDSGIIKVIESIDPSLIKRLDENKNILHLVNGSMAFARSAESPGSIEGENFHAIWVDEPAELWRQGGDSCVFRKRAEPGVRLKGAHGEPVRKLFTGTPDEASPLILDIHESVEKNPRRYAWSTLSTRDNIANIDEAIVEEVLSRATEEYINSKIDGKLLLQSKNALVNEEALAKARVSQGEARWVNPEDIDLYVAVDANHADNKKSDECGILIGGAYKGDGVMIADASTPGGPEVWSDRIIDVLLTFPEIDTIIIEDDKSLVVKVVKQLLEARAEEIGRPIKLKPVSHNNKSKKARAEPVAVLYHRGKMRHCPSPRRPEWNLEKYELQWKIWNPKKSDWSPDRVDAGVYLLTDQVLGARRPDEFFAPSDVTWA